MKLKEKASPIDLNDTANADILKTIEQKQDRDNKFLIKFDRVLSLTLN